MQYKLPVSSAKKVLKLLQAFHYEEALANAYTLKEKKFRKEYAAIARAGLGQKADRGNYLAVIASAVFHSVSGEPERAKGILKKLSTSLKPEFRSDFHLASMQVFNDLGEFATTKTEYQLLLFYRPSTVQREKAEILAQFAQEKLDAAMVGTGSLQEGDASYVQEEEYMLEEEEDYARVESVPQVADVKEV